MPRRVTLMCCSCATTGATAATNSAKPNVRQTLVTTLLPGLFANSITAYCSELFAAQLAGLFHPLGELNFVERVILVDVEVAHFFMLGLAWRHGAQ